MKANPNAGPQSDDIRRSFLEFFSARGHRVVRSSSLVPAADPTLLFTNAGMNQFKDVFLGLERRDYNRAASSQKCLRVSGKHNDLENVGRTRRHHTFFEMLGNFSFGDYFKQEAIAFAWELMTGVWKLPAEKLIATVYREDDDAYRIWEKEIGIPSARLFRLGEEDNFWAMGDTGPCGPCSEIQMDFGPAASEMGHTDCKFPCDCGRYVELWNLVFMQYNRYCDLERRKVFKTKEEAREHRHTPECLLSEPLSKPSVDTGVGLERVAAALQSKVSNYDTDLFQPLIEHASELADKDYGSDARTDMALRVIADHSRAAAFVVGDGVLPSNEGRGYVLRKIIRRAIDYGRQLGLEKPFLFEIAGQVAELMREPYPELLENLQRISTVIKHEEEKYARLVVPAQEQFIKRLESKYQRFDLKSMLELMADKLSPEEMERAKFLDQLADPEGRLLIEGEDLFFAYSTLGLRPDLVRDIADARGWWIVHTADRDFERLLEQERERAKASWKGVAREVASPVYQGLADKQPTKFLGYQQTTATDCRVVALVTKEGSVKEIPAGTEAELVLDHTPFYAESGGQVGDTGRLLSPENDQEVAEVRGTFWPLAGVIVHKIRAKERLAVGDRVRAVVNEEARAATMRNHTGTHLLHAALRQVLGPHVKQAGSLVAPDRLRFDFAHYAALDPEELKEIERLANQQILRDAPVTEERMDLDQALRSGALAFFGDKYPEKNVRVISIPDPAEETGFYSKELCGGTHVVHTGQIGVVKVLTESSVAAGVRRIEAVSGAGALEFYQRALIYVEDLYARASGASVLSFPKAAEQYPDPLEIFLTDPLNRKYYETAKFMHNQAAIIKDLKNRLELAQDQIARSRVDIILNSARVVKGVKIVSDQLHAVSPATIRSLVDVLRQKLGSGVVVLGTIANGKVSLVVGVTKDLTNRLHAGKIIKEVAQRVGGTGGGRPDLAEAGGKYTGELTRALEDIYAIIEKML